MYYSWLQINNIRSKTNKHLRSCLTADAAIDIKILLKNEDRNAQNSVIESPIKLLFSLLEVAFAVSYFRFGIFLNTILS
jgi:hypothetical protein